MQDKSSENKKFYTSKLRELVRINREKANKSIYMISAEASVPRSTWRDLEYGLRKDINLYNFCKIAEGLDIPPDKLLNELLTKLGKDFSFTE